MISKTTSIILTVVFWALLAGLVYLVWVKTAGKETWLRVLLSLLSAFGLWLIWFIAIAGYALDTAAKSKGSSKTGVASPSKH